ncbi:MAG: hypothetical protein EOP87_22335, partial [Verrucomicrobiaceae bacterium]
MAGPLWRQPCVWISGVGGLVLGVACQQAFRGDGASSPGGATDKKQASGKAADRSISTPRAGRSSAALQKAAVADAAECEALVLEIARTEDPTRVVEMEVALRRWMAFRKPVELAELLQKET